MTADSVAIVVQARAGSSRLPGKVLRPFGASTVLGHIVARLLRTGLPVVVATSDAEADDAVAAEATRAGAATFRGSEADVLGRFADCVRSVEPLPECVVRVCADRPLICPTLVDEVLDWARLAGGADYVCNNLPRSFPDGLDLELVRTDILLEAAAEATDPYEREHVTPFVYRRPERYGLLNLPCAYGNFASIRAALDTEADYAGLTGVHERLAALDPDYTYRDVLNLASVAPEVFPAG